jgi:zinc protease
MQGAVADSLAGNWLSGLPADFLGRYVPMIREVDAARVEAMARKYYAPERQSIVVVGDAGAIAPQLEAFGTFAAPAE